MGAVTRFLLVARSPAPQLVQLTASWTTEMQSRVFSLIAVVLILLAGLALWPRGEDAAAGLAAPAVDEPVAAAVAQSAADQDVVNRTAVTGAIEADEVTPEPATVAITILVLARGAPVEGAAVSLVGEDLVTDAEGRARFLVEPQDIGLSWSKLHVGVETDRAGLSNSSGWIRVHRDGDQEVVVTLRHAETSFWARLTSAESGQPLSGMRLSVLQRRDVRGEVTTDASGLVSVTADPQDTGLRIEDPAWAPLVVAVMAGHTTAAEALEVKVDAAARLDLRLVDAQGHAVADGEARVWWFPTDAARPLGLARGGWKRERSANGGADGKLRLERLPPGVPLKLEAKLRSQPLAAVEQRVWLEPGRNEISLVIDGSGTVEGRVVDEAGMPVKDVSVTATRYLDGDPVFSKFPEFRVAAGAPRGVTSDDGGFVLRGLAAGRWWVGVMLGDGEHLPGCAPVTVWPDAPVQVELLAGTPRAIAGRVEGPDGEPVATTVYAYRDDLQTGGRRDYLYCETDDEGVFELAPLAAGAWQVAAEPAGTLGVLHPLRVDAGSDDTVLHLVSVTGVLRGRVATADGHGARAWVTVRSQDNVEHEYAKWTDLDGRFDFDGLPQGTWDLMADDKAGGIANRSADVLAGNDVELGDVTQHPAAAVLLRNFADGTEPIDALVFAGPVGNWQASSVRVGYTRWALPPGAWTLVAERQGREAGRRQVKLTAGKTLTIGF